jgi:hypothetical protein
MLREEDGPKSLAARTGEGTSGLKSLVTLLQNDRRCSGQDQREAKGSSSSCIFVVVAVDDDDDEDKDGTAVMG